MKFIVWASSFDDGIGGIIALHLLCRRLNELGHDASIWPAWKPRLWNPLSLRQLLRQVKWRLDAPRRPQFRSPFGSRIASAREVNDAIVIYPEIVPGNPLGARRVVRWLLHKPGYHTGAAAFGSNDLFFHYQDAFADPDIPSSRLTLTWVNEAYQDRGRPDRAGSAYLLRKGKGRPIVHDLTDSVLVDELSHEERAEVFNRVRFFYSYDLYTMYSAYAAICGAVPVIVPDPAVSREEWVPELEDRYGLAYGTKEVPWAIESRTKLLERLKQKREDEDRMLRNFVCKCEETLC